MTTERSAGRMSVALTLDAVRARTKLVTRRHSDSWRRLQPGDVLTLIEKGMGLPKGATQTVVCRVRITSVRLESLVHVDENECALEGLPHLTPDEFRRFWCDAHGYRGLESPAMLLVVARRIAWEYL